MSINDDCGNDFEPLSLDATTSFPETQIETLLPLFENTRGSEDITAQQWKRSSKRSNENRLGDAGKRRKQRFWMIVRVLMRYLERKDTDLYNKARNILGDCATHHVLKDDEFTNLTESVQRELIRTVGTRYWERAERHASNHLITMKAIEETKLRKHRFWMLVKVLMRYLEKKDPELYKRARTTLKDCEKSHLMKEERFTNLVDSVQRELTQVVGMRYWKRAERHVTKHITKKAAIAKMGSSVASPIMAQHEQQSTDPNALRASFYPPR